MHEGPHRAVIHLHPTHLQLVSQPVQGESLAVRRPRDQPITMREERPRTVPRHRTGRGSPGPAVALRPLHHARLKHQRHGPDRLAVIRATARSRKSAE